VLQELRVREALTILDLEKAVTEKDQRIEDLQLSVAFCELNAGTDTMRLQHLEEQFNDLLNAVVLMQDKLCICGDDEVQVFF